MSRETNGYPGQSGPSNEGMPTQHVREKDEPQLDPEQIAALLDGRLSDAERRALLEAVAESADTAEVLADAAAIIGEEPDSRSLMLPRALSAPVGRRSRWPTPARLAAAAVIVVLVGIGLIRSRPRSLGSGFPDYAALMAGGDASWTSLPEVWSATRGVETTSSSRARSVRVGARLTDLERSIRARDTGVASAAISIARLLESIPASAPVVAALRDIARNAGQPTPDLLSRFEVAGPAALSLVNSELAGVGAWLEAARIAASSHDAEFFQRPTSRDGARRARRVPDLTPTESGVLDKLSEGTSPAAAMDWFSVEAATTTLLKRVGG